MNPRTRPIAAAVVCLGAAVMIALTWHRESPSRGTAIEPQSLASRPAGSVTEKPTAGLSDAGHPSSHERIATLLQHTLDELRRNPVDSRHAIDRLQDAIRNEPDELAAARAINDFLHSGEDAATTLPFAVGPDGCIASPPTLRIALLDLLPALDPMTALALSRELIQQASSPDEYALALRNLAWNDLDGDLHGELSAAFFLMLDRQAWLDHPSAGFLEAFDIALQVASPAAFSRLSELVASRRNPADAPLARAATITLDRLILRDPSLLTHARRRIPRWLDEAPRHRASLMSRLDLTREDHQALFVEYLADPRLEAAERGLFSELFPNGNHLHGHRLVSAAEPVPGIGQRRQLDQRILAILRQIEPGAPPPATPTIQAIIRRLEAHTRP